MGVVIDKTVQFCGEEGGDEPLTQNHWNQEELPFTGGHAGRTTLTGVDSTLHVL